MALKHTDRGSDGNGEQAAFRMKIGGLSCSFCTSTIDKAFSRIDGVYEVGVSLGHGEGEDHHMEGVYHPHLGECADGTYASGSAAGTPYHIHAT